MRIYAYLRVLSDEATISTFSKEARIPDASVKQLKARRSTSTTDVGTWWDWQTPRVPIDVESADAGLKALLLTYRSMFPVAQIQRGSETDIYLEIVTQYEKNESPRGLYLSAETICLLSELGAAIDNDVEILGNTPALERPGE